MAENPQDRLDPETPEKPETPENKSRRRRRKDRREQTGGKSRPPREPKRSSGKGLAALMLVTGLLLGTLLGGLIGVLAPPEGVREALPGTPGSRDREPATTPAPAPTPRTVEVVVPQTPQECLDALDDLLAFFGELGAVRESLLAADISRAGGDDQGADQAHAEVDRQLRWLVIAGNARSLQSAVAECRALGPPQAPETPDPDEPGPEPTPGPTVEPTPGPTVEPTPGFTVVPFPDAPVTGGAEPAPTP